MIHVAAVDQAFLLLLIVFCLGSCLVRRLLAAGAGAGSPYRHIAPPAHKEA
ncbi:hypothetical protein [Bradyrhizobium diazoefficiens]